MLEIVVGVGQLGFRLVEFGLVLTSPMPWPGCSPAPPVTNLDGVASPDVRKGGRNDIGAQRVEAKSRTMILREADLISNAELLRTHLAVAGE